jgi:TPR repeat protein
VAPESAVASTLPFKTYLKAVDGSAIDQAGIGSMYTNGVDKVLAKDLPRAAYWSQKSALSGNPVGQLGYGMLMFWGMGIKENRTEGYKWVKQSASIDSSNTEVLKQLESEMTPAEISASR